MGSILIWCHQLHLQFLQNSEIEELTTRWSEEPVGPRLRLPKYVPVLIPKLITCV